MEKRERAERNNFSSFTYDEAGTMEVSRQIMDSYNSGVVDTESMRNATDRGEE
ncbi:hypothetical protein SAMN05192533_102398 [Mesobacillus persicus]|uniref:Uncharacterized protein n=1 Tax=Mesobacillus persicus TaxID=930146 RepID=A0A1H7XVT6_9BACI|nr:hypothetical protein [Mesobacillus persicus]SEM38072.1 hypothetical protein SAMN05192533_102398 [Mesobacillus persicus]